MSGDGVLVLAGTPIGDTDDASPALRREIAAADVVAAEDTRRFRRLAERLGVPVRSDVVSYFDVNEAARTEQLMAVLLAGGRVLLLTDAGMPVVSDPGYRLVAAAAAAGVRVTAVAGPSAVTTALAVSGLPSDRFCFEGFLPRRPGARRERLLELAGEPRTMIFFESRHRLSATLSALADAFGADRVAVACRELTKTHEEVCRGSLGRLADWAGGAPRGEITLVVAGVPAGPSPAGNLVPGGYTGKDGAVTRERDLADRVAAAEAAGLTRKAAIAAVAASVGVPKRQVYAAVVAAARGARPDS